ncbi:MAG: hypothetical protein JJ863_07115 [Deltaproteobacteria bacterium]|nr:hypothetical protein [Deltaproteobacteria bacterium]
MMGFVDRLPLLLLAFGVAVACDASLTARDGFGVALDDPSERDRKSVRQFRVMNAVAAILWLVAIGTRRRADLAFGATLLWAIIGPAMVMAGAAIRARRHRDPAIPGPRYLDPHAPAPMSALISWPLQLLHASTLAVVCIFFRWTLPYLPSVAPVHWAAEGPGYTSPTKLWWALALIAFNLSMILFSAWAASGPAFTSDDDGPEDPEERREAGAIETQRRVISVRLVETLLIGFNLIAMAMWVTAILRLLPGADASLAPTGAIVAAALTGTVLLATLSLHLPALLRLRKRGHSPPSEPPKKQGPPEAK